VNISKLDAARRQLETAVTLYFHDGDPVSIHTLTGAAYEILLNLTRAKGETTMIKDLVKDYIKPQFVKELSRKLNEAQNFFKHADKHPDAILTTFEPEQTNLLLLDACWTYRRLSGERLPLLHVFETWASVTWGKNFITYVGMSEADHETFEELAALSRSDFFTKILPVAYAVAMGKPPSR
jgi:hypothetical protein